MKWAGEGIEMGGCAWTGCPGDSDVHLIPDSSHLELLCLYLTVLEIIDVLMKKFASLSFGLRQQL